LLRSNPKGYGDKTQQTGSQNSDTTAPSGRELYHLQFLLQVASPETLGYTLIQEHGFKNISTQEGGSDDTGENYTTSSFITCMLHQILLG
jgi:hypothetical protein